MPHQCVKCSALYSDDAQEPIAGCPCGGKAFFFLKPSRIVEAQGIAPELRNQILATTTEQDAPIILDLETINITADGKYELDLNALFGKNELIYKENDGKYTIDLLESFRRHKKDE